MGWMGGAWLAHALLGHFGGEGELRDYVSLLAGSGRPAKAADVHAGVHLGPRSRRLHGLVSLPELVPPKAPSHEKGRSIGGMPPSRCVFYLSCPTQ